MRITKIEQQKNVERYSLYVDGEFYLGVHEMTLAKHNIYKQQEVSRDLLECIRQSEMQHRTYQKALNYLARGERSAFEIRQYLYRQFDKMDDIQKQDYAALQVEDTIEEAIGLLMEQGYLNDEIFATHYVQDIATLQLKGPQLIAYQLKQKGVARDVIDIALDSYTYEQQWDNMMNLAMIFLKSKKQLPLKVQRQKVIEHLLKKGYYLDDIKECVDELDFEEDDDAQRKLVHETGMNVYRRRRIKYEGRELLYHVKAGLYAKGYDRYLIDEWLDDNEELFEEE